MPRKHSSRLGYVRVKPVSFGFFVQDAIAENFNAEFSASHYANSWAWRIPTITQAALPAIVMSLVLFFPESPRWLIHKDRTEDALAVLAKYHGAGDPHAALVQLEYREILEDRANNPSDDRWWDFRELIRDRQSRYRTAIVIALSFFGQWSGNNVVSYFMVSLGLVPILHFYRTWGPGYERNMLI